MALVTLSGYPASGKTTRAFQLCKLLEASQSLSVVVWNDENLGLPASAYDTAATEKIARATLMSAVIRNLGKDKIVIMDGMNYVKGFRYQLYCAAREVGVRTLTIHIAAPKDKCTEWNKAREKQYADATLDNLMSRFEEPSYATRWDTPLITLPWDQADLPEEEILNAIQKGELKPPTGAVVPVSRSSGDYLQRLEAITNAVLEAILSTQAIQPGGGQKTVPVTLPSSSARFSISLTLPSTRTVNASQLQRLRRQYTALNKQAMGKQPSADVPDQQLAHLFAEYIESQLN